MKLFQFIKDVVNVATFRGITYSLSFIAVFFFSNALSPKDFGVISLIGNGIAFLILGFGLNLETSVSRYFGKFTNPHKDVFYPILKFQILFGLALSIAAFISIFATVILFDFEAKPSLFALCLIILSAFLAQLRILIEIMFRMEELLSKYILSSTVFSVLVTVLGMLAVYIEPSLDSYIAGLFLAYVLGTGFAIFTARLELKSVVLASLENIKTFLSFSIPLLPAAAAMFFNTWIDRWFVATMMNLENVGIYAIGEKLGSIITMSLSILMFILLPKTMQALDSDDKLAKTELDVFIRLVVVCSTILIFGLQLVGPFMIQKLTSTFYLSASSLVGVFGMSAMFYSLTYFSTLGSWKGERSWHYTLSVFIGLAINVFFNTLLIPWIGLIGAAIGTSLGMLTTLLVSFFLSQKVHDFDFPFLRIFSSIGICVLGVFLMIEYYGVEPHQIMLGMVISCSNVLLILILNLRKSEVISLIEKAKL